jgi:hypothetical protein
VIVDWGLGVQRVTRSKFHGTFLGGLTYTYTRAIKHPRVTVCHDVSPCVGHVQVVPPGHDMLRFAQIGGMRPAWVGHAHTCMDMSHDVYTWAMMSNMWASYRQDDAKAAHMSGGLYTQGILHVMTLGHMGSKGHTSITPLTWHRVPSTLSLSAIVPRIVPCAHVDIGNARVGMHWAG